MIDLLPEIKGELDSLRKLISCDVAAVAWIHSSHNSFRWRYVSGSRSDRYQRISFKIGYGISGMAVRLGRPLETSPLLQDTYSLKQESALMLAEQLHSAFATPIFGTNHLPQGVVLVGKRSTYSFVAHDIALVEQTARRLGALKLSLS
ncbi:GAF domain-containing protein [Paenibacillus sp. P96]|uniref:GAF domain-containing protein n=1 Tax=Paenibacillus zeirhizosphaerae TaxID=2987519 RepID=A0ABT9FMW6_9BACL|nr:GAF domain-containing protein [Paenibacillus sp. P96]MDP4096062.1 GAF domain-containing protein [Paenibacillus sp. P96]